MMNFPRPPWGRSGKAAVRRLNGAWHDAEVLEGLLDPTLATLADTPTANLPVLWKPPLPVSPRLPKLAPSMMTAKYFGPQLRHGPEFGPKASLQQQMQAPSSSTDTSWVTVLPQPQASSLVASWPSMTTCPSMARPHLKVVTDEAQADDGDDWDIVSGDLKSEGRTALEDRVLAKFPDLTRRDVLSMSAGALRAKLDDDSVSVEVTVVDTPADTELYATPDQRRFVIERHPQRPSDDIAGQDEFPWYVEEITYGDDRDDYGRMSTQADALTLVGFMVNGNRVSKF